MILTSIRKLLDLPSQLKQLSRQVSLLEAEVQHLKQLSGRSIEILLEREASSDLAAHEFRVSSQFGDDGIIHRLITSLRPRSQRFIEFGVQDYSESNTRYLLETKNWSGLIIDADRPSMENLRKQTMYWRYDITSVAAFITRDNINDLFRQNGFSGEIGLLSIDIDGNDYWVWEAIDSVDAEIVVAEYNSLFGPDLAVSVPYRADFYRLNAHHSGQYWGASLAALEFLADKKGYRLIGCNAAGNNCYFVKKTAGPEFPTLTPKEAYVAAKWRDARDRDGRLTFATHAQNLQILGDLDLVDVRTGQSHKIAALWKAKS